MAKQIIYSDEARSKLMDGVKQLSASVRVTIGPRGRNVVLERTYGPPIITNDGVTIVRELEFPDLFENLGAALVKEVATKTNDVAGDGTTTATILVEAILVEGIRNITAGANPMIVKNGMKKALEEIIKGLKKLSKTVTTKEEKAQVASISSADKELGELIASIMEELGDSAIITVEESQTFGLEKEVVSGMQFDKGYISPYMITDVTRNEAILEDAPILLCDGRVSSIPAILPILKTLSESGTKKLIIIADNIDNEALSTLIVNNLKGSFHTIAVRAPAFGDRRKAVLQDIAVLTGATVISEEIGLKLEDVTVEHLGRVKKIISTKDTTTIQEGAGSKEYLETRMEHIKQLIEQSKSDFDKEKLEERLAKLGSGVAVIRVGAATEVELKEKKFKIEDALNATKAAVEEGILPGGGVALASLVKSLDSIKTDSDDEKTGVNIIKSALIAPLKQIAENAGKEGAVVVTAVQNMKKGNGYDALKDEMDVDMIARGIVDPTKVTRSAIENAISVATIFLTTEAVIANIPIEEGKDSGVPFKA